MTPPRRSLRPAAPADRPFVRALALQAFADLGEHAAEVPEWLSGPGASGRIVLEDGEPAGFSITCLAMLPAPVPAPRGKLAREPMCLDLMALAVVPERRGRGLGRCLLEDAIAEALRLQQSLRIVEMTLTVAESNEPARRLFADAGFLPTRRTGRYPGGQTALHLHLPLESVPEAG